MNKLKWSIVGIIGVLIYQEVKIERLRNRLLETNDLLIDYVDADFQERVDEVFEEITESYDE